MRRIAALAAVVLTATLAGCVPTLSRRPLFDSEERVAEAGLVGVWVMEGNKGDDALTFRAAGEKAYELVYMLVYKDDKKELRLGRGELARLGNYLFLDVTWAGSTEGLHWFFRVRLDGDTLELADLDHDWVRHSLKEKKIQIAYEIVDNGIVLTAPSKDLQALALKYADDPHAFKTLKFNRRKETPAPTKPAPGVTQQQEE